MLGGELTTGFSPSPCGSRHTRCSQTTFAPQISPGTRHSSEIPGVFPSSCSTREMHEPEVELQAGFGVEKENSLIFPGSFYSLLWIPCVNHEALWPLQVSPERGKRLTHVWKGGGWSFAGLCVRRHLISEHHGAFWPRWALGRGLFASSREAGDAEVPSPSPREKGNSLFCSKHGKFEACSLKASGQTTAEQQTWGYFCQVFLHNRCFLPDWVCRTWVLPSDASRLPDELGFGWGSPGRANPGANPVTSSAIFNSNRDLGF